MHTLAIMLELLATPKKDHQISLIETSKTKQFQGFRISHSVVCYMMNVCILYIGHIGKVCTKHLMGSCSQHYTLYNTNHTTMTVVETLIIY